MAVGEVFVLAFVPAACVVGILFALAQWYIVSRVTVGGHHSASNNGYMHVDEDGVDDPSVVAKCAEIQAAISEGSESFLATEYQYLSVFMGIFSVIIFVFLASVGGFSFNRQPCDFDPAQSCPSSIANAFFSTVAFILGAITSTLSGYLGMRIATYANARTTLEVQIRIRDGLPARCKRTLGPLPDHLGVQALLRG
jgi:hypothetical protein